MSDTEIRTLNQVTFTITKCPVLLESDEGVAYFCNEDLEVVVDKAIIGDDYGSWPEYGVYFKCGHTLEQMKNSYRYGDQI